MKGSKKASYRHFRYNPYAPLFLHPTDTKKIGHYLKFVNISFYVQTAADLAANNSFAKIIGCAVEYLNGKHNACTAKLLFERTSVV